MTGEIELYAVRLIRIIPSKQHLLNKRGIAKPLPFGFFRVTFAGDEVEEKVPEDYLEIIGQLGDQTV